MPSPFPGLDPYLESAEWVSVHVELSSEIARQRGLRRQTTLGGHFGCRHCVRISSPLHGCCGLLRARWALLLVFDAG